MMAIRVVTLIAAGALASVCFFGLVEDTDLVYFE